MQIAGPVNSDWPAKPTLIPHLLIAIARWPVFWFDLACQCRAGKRSDE
jgi:hypothetical protein